MRISDCSSDVCSSDRLTFGRQARLFFCLSNASRGLNHIQYDLHGKICAFRNGACGRRNMATLPLAGIRVLDISQVMAGPFCCMLLGDMGADVIKIEPPKTGDSTRHSMGFRLKGEDSPGFLALNQNKRSIARTLKAELGRASCRERVCRYV